MRNKVKLTFLLLFISMHLMAPPSPASLYIPTSESIYNPNWIYYSPLANAVYKHESNCNPLAYNPKENAVGGFQIRQCKLDEYNRIMGTNHKLEECYNYNFAKNIFLFFAEGKSFEQAAKNWNGSGPMTISYWENVKKLL
jgi:hypothetical protein